MPPFARLSTPTNLRLTLLLVVTHVLVVASTARPAAVGASAGTGTSRITQMYLFGDESVDAGNAQMIKSSTLKANWPPYGFNFQPGSGRACDGELVCDMLASYFKIPPARPSMHRPSASAPFHGINFAVAGAGARWFTNTGRTRSLQQQFSAFKSWFRKDQQKTMPQMIPSEAIFVISIGMNDYIPKLAAPEPNMAGMDLTALAGTATIASVTKQMFELTNSSRIVVFDLPPLGCLPIVRLAHGMACENNCTVQGTDVTARHNSLLQSWLDALRTDSGIRMSDLVLFKQSRAFEEFILVEGTGFTDLSHVCCGAIGPKGKPIRCGETDQGSSSTGTNSTGSTTSTTSTSNTPTGSNTGSSSSSSSTSTPLPALPCTDPSQLVWWDWKNPTSMANQYLAMLLYKTTDETMVHPGGGHSEAMGAGGVRAWRGHLLQHLKSTQSTSGCLSAHAIDTWLERSDETAVRMCHQSAWAPHGHE